MNRAERRSLARGGDRVTFLVAEALCDRCGAPVCPRCGVESSVCECCGEFNCQRCGAYVMPPVPRAD